MTTQTEMFPKTTAELLDELLEAQREEYNKAVKALSDLEDDEKIAKRYEKAEASVAKARRLVQAIQQAVEREQADVGLPLGCAPTPPLPPRKPVEVDPITGEVESNASHCVVAVYPGDDPHATEVGQFTRYGELVADYGTYLGVEVAMGDYQVIGEDDGKARDLGAGIAAADYGHRLLIVERVGATAA